MSASQQMTAVDLTGLSNAELVRLERQIAQKHSGMVPWGIVAWAFANLLCWLALWPLVFLEVIPLWLGFVIASLNISLVYLPTHEAQHHIIGRPGTRWHWLNELVGHATSWMFLYPFEVLRVTHLDHHRFSNNPDLDPDITNHADGPLSAIWVSIQQRQPGAKRVGDYLGCLARSKREDLIRLTLVYRLAYFGILIALAWTGHALEAFFLWWLPYQIAATYTNFFLSYAPHSPGMQEGRYRDTKNWRSKVGNIGSMGMQFHIVHHLHPYIPLTRTPAAYWEMRPILVARGCKLEM
ncbi:Oxidoreductase [Sphingopyxis sp. LC81]|uniref:fatty acid desaturase n=1 Tax=Sphingopyxis sp. LC81 TaxID=1502850 RepID=UPI0005100BAA|nr:fatty acid desaturase [Sphingopyxis sp. LC81]KGB53079.1 Oxidoreductase [Sphingopyxis sp. LC81]